MRSERILIYLSYGVIIRDKVGNFGQVWRPNTLRKRVEFAHKNSISQYFSLNSQFKAFSFSLCSPMSYTFSFQRDSWVKR